jgi:hypothetical protein
MKNVKINKALQTLDREGYFTSRWLADCRTCGWAQIDDVTAKKAVFTTDQSEDSAKKDGALYFDWAGNGKKISKAFTDQGLTVEWNGKKTMRIIVKS